MSRNKANEQALVWLQSMMADPDSFNAINAENCLSMIHRQRKQLLSLGAHFCNVKKQRNKAWEKLKKLEGASVNACTDVKILPRF